jgi:ribosome-binding factor A
VAAHVIDNELGDTRIGVTTVTDVKMSGDLQIAYIFWTTFAESESIVEDTAAALESGKGVVRREIGKVVNTRLTPELRFIHDEMPRESAELANEFQKARLADEELDKLRKTAQFAGDANPYKEPKAKSIADDNEL